MAKNYTAEHVGELEGLDKIVQNPGMYVGDNAEVGLNTLRRELVDNAVDEHLAGHGEKVEVTISKSGALKVADEGRGIPVEWKKEAGMSALELVLTRIHAGGKFKDSLSYVATRRGLHGAGGPASAGPQRPVAGVGFAHCGQRGLSGRLCTGGDEHVLRRGVDAVAGRVAGDHFAQGPIAFGGAVLQGGRAPLAQYAPAGLGHALGRKGLGRGQAARKRDHLGPLGEFEQFAAGRAGEAPGAAGIAE